MREAADEPRATVLWCGDEPGAFPPLAERFAADHDVVRDVAANEPFVLIAQGTDAASAVERAIGAGSSCAALVLLAPVFASLPVRTPDVPTLILLGMDDRFVPPSAAASLCAAFPRANPVIVYGAGHALDRERVDAVASVVGDFIVRGDAFIVRDTSDALYS